VRNPNADQSKSIVVTGGRGFLGRATVKLLRRAGFPVLSLDRNPVEMPASGPGEEIQCDLANRAQLRPVFETEQVRAIIHLAAVLPTAAQQNPLLATEVNIQASSQLFEMARQFGVQRVVFGSSLSIYGTYSAEQMISEQARAAPEDLYGAAKLYVEQLGQAYRECHGVDFVSLRIGRVVGPGARSTTSAWRSQIFELLKTEYPCEILLPYRAAERILVLHVDDVAAMLMAVIGAPQMAHSVYNAPCSAIVVGELKRLLEHLNRKISVRLADAVPAGNPQMLDFRRFQNEFRLETVAIFDRLRTAAGK